MKKIGYARVSTRDQNLEMQLHALKQAGCEKIFTEKKSGRRMDRPVLKRLLKQSNAGDTIIVWKIDRIGRSAKDLCEIIDTVRKKCVIIISLTEGINTSTMIGEVFFKLAGIFAEIEINGRSERTREGIKVARLKGKRIGRPPGICISQEEYKLIVDLNNNGNSKKDISLKTGVPISSVYRYLKLKNINNILFEFIFILNFLHLRRFQKTNIF